MESTREKIAYLKGIIDGDSSLKEERIRFLFENTMGVLEEIARDLDELALAQKELEDYLQEIDFDLTDLEDDFYVEEEDGEDWLGADEEQSFLELECPQCGEKVTLDKALIFREGVRIQCPDCGALVFESSDSEDLLEEGLDDDEY
ncbi:MAG: hypothetical protein GX335_05135 [Firmicutes bacterium]|nr:hypothetical protein [Bacillota bacterium]